MIWGGVGGRSFFSCVSVMKKEIFRIIMNSIPILLVFEGLGPVFLLYFLVLRCACIPIGR